MQEAPRHKKWKTQRTNYHSITFVACMLIKRACWTCVLLLKWLSCLTSVSKFSYLAHSSWLDLCCDSAIIYLLFSCLAIGGDHSSFTLAVHLGGCSDTLFYPTRHLSKKATRKTYYLHSYPVSVVSLSLPCALFAPVSFFSTSPTLPTNQAGFQPGGNLKQSTGGAFFFFSIAVPGFSSRPPCCERVGAS